MGETRGNQGNQGKPGGKPGTETRETRDRRAFPTFLPRETRGETKGTDEHFPHFSRRCIPRLRWPPRSSPFQFTHQILLQSRHKCRPERSSRISRLPNRPVIVDRRPRLPPSIPSTKSGKSPSRFRESRLASPASNAGILQPRQPLEGSPGTRLATPRVSSKQGVHALFHRRAGPVRSGISR